MKVQLYHHGPPRSALGSIDEAVAAAAQGHEPGTGQTKGTLQKLVDRLLLDGFTLHGQKIGFALPSKTGMYKRLPGVRSLDRV